MTTEQLLQLVAEGKPGWYGLAASLVVLAVRAYRTEVVQCMLPRNRRWVHLQPWVRYAVVFGASLLSALVAARLAGQSWMAGALAALPVAVAAAAGHKVTKAAGYAQTARRIAKQGLAYEPTSLRTSLELLLPIDQDALRPGRNLRNAVRWRKGTPP